MLTLEKVGQRVYLVGLPFLAKDDAKETLGMTGKNWDGERRLWFVGVAKLAAAEAFAAKINDPNAAKLVESPDQIRLTGKGRYKGTVYYAGAVVNGRVRLLTLPDADGKFLDFWADCREVEEVKTYTPRQVWDGRRGSNNKVTVYTTLGSIAKFIADQKAAEKAGLPQCAACRKRVHGLIEDLEDGLMKCRGCCDLPSE